jgi:hypothetical protein
VLWDGVSDAVGSGRPVSGNPLAEPGQVPPDLRTFMNAVFAGPVTAYQFGVTPVTTDDAVADAPDLYRLDIGEVVLVFASVAPSSVVAANPSVSVQLDSAFDFDVTRAAVTRLLFVGANVLLVRQIEGPPGAVTEVRSVVRLDAQQTGALTRMLGPIEVVDQDEPVEGIEVQVILGTDFEAFLASVASSAPLDDAEGLLTDDDVEAQG